MRRYFLLLTVSIQSLLIAIPALANEVNQKSDHKLTQVISDIPSLSEIQLPAKSAKLLTQPSASTEVKPSSTIGQVTQPQTDQNTTDDTVIELEVTGEKDTLPQSSPVYTIEKEEIEKQGANSAAEILRGLPGFAVNDAGFGADIHTGTYYRGQSINQSVFLLNGRPINTNINTYHGNIDLNSIPVESIDRVELFSGTASTLYGSEAFGGVVNIVTKQGQGTPRFNALVQYGSYGEENYRASYGGAVGSARFNLSYERYNADNDYRVPVGAANRGSNGRLFNGDTATSNYVGSFTYDINRNNTVSLDAYAISSRRGLLYFGASPTALNRDRLNHDVLNVGLAWRSLLGGSKDSVLNANIGYNKDYFNTYNPAFGTSSYRQGSLDSQGLTARVEHQWQLNKNNLLRWGLDIKNLDLEGDILSNNPQRIRYNGTVDENQFQAALFALNTWNITDYFLVDLGLRQNFNTKFGSYINPSVGLRLAASSNIAVRGSWASVQRNPGLDQLYVYDTVHGWDPNPDLKSETGSSWTAGVDIKFAKNLTGQFTYFGSSLDNRLAVNSASKWSNIGLVNTNGYEAALRWQIAREWSTFLNYTYTDAYIESGPEQGLQLSTVPFSVAQLGVGYQSNGWQVNLIASYNSGARRAIFANTSLGFVSTDFSPSWLNLDLGARIPISRNFGVNLFVENLADVQYEKVNRIYSPGRTFRIGVSANF